MRLEQDQSTHPRLLRNKALGNAAPDSGAKSKAKQAIAKGSRFVGPTQLDEAKKMQLCNALERLGIGDEMGRAIFVGAVEYQIGAFAEQLESTIEPEHGPETEPKPKPRVVSAALEPTLQAIVGNAASLSSLLRALPEDAIASVIDTLADQDDHRRSHDGRYLSELASALDRLGHACIIAAGKPARPKAKPKPEPDPEPKPKPAPPSAANRELVAKLAGAFHQCFESEPTADEDGAFRATLGVLNDVTGLSIAREPKLLAKVLAARSPRGRAG